MVGFLGEQLMFKFVLCFQNKNVCHGRVAIRDSGQCTRLLRKTAEVYGGSENSSMHFVGDELVDENQDGIFPDSR